jgi:hypothetical protein
MRQDHKFASPPPALLPAPSVQCAPVVPDELSPLQSIDGVLALRALCVLCVLCAMYALCAMCVMCDLCALFALCVHAFVPRAAR